MSTPVFTREYWGHWLCWAVIAALWAVLGYSASRRWNKAMNPLQRQRKGFWLMFSLPSVLVEWQFKTWQISIRFYNLWRQRLQNPENTKMLCFHKDPWNTLFFMQTDIVKQIELLEISSDKTLSSAESKCSWFSACENNWNMLFQDSFLFPTACPSPFTKTTSQESERTWWKAS